MGGNNVRERSQQTAQFYLLRQAKNGRDTIGEQKWWGTAGGEKNSARPALATPINYPAPVLSRSVDAVSEW